MPELVGRVLIRRDFDCRCIQVCSHILWGGIGGRKEKCSFPILMGHLTLITKMQCVSHSTEGMQNTKKAESIEHKGDRTSNFKASWSSPMASLRRQQLGHDLSPQPCRCGIRGWFASFSRFHLHRLFWQAMILPSACSAWAVITQGPSAL